MATIMLPVHLAGYRERGVIRRFDISGFPRLALRPSVLASGITVTVPGLGALPATAHLAFGLPSVEDWGRTLAGLVLGTLAFVSLGVAIGSLMLTARAAQGLGLGAVLPPVPPGRWRPTAKALWASMRDMAQWLPLTHVIRGSPAGVGGAKLASWNSSIDIIG